MSNYFIIPLLWGVVPFAICAVVVIFALRKSKNVNASFGSKRFQFALSVSDSPPPSAPDVAATVSPALSQSGSAASKEAAIASAVVPPALPAPASSAK